MLQFELFFLLLAEFWWVFLLLGLVIPLLLGSIWLMLGLKAVKADETGFGTVFVTNLIGVLLNLIPCIGCLIYWLAIIPKRHDIGRGAALGALVISWLISAVINAILLFTLFTGFYVALMGLIGSLMPFPLPMP